MSVARLNFSHGDHKVYIIQRLQHILIYIYIYISIYIYIRTHSTLFNRSLYHVHSRHCIPPTSITFICLFYYVMRILIYSLLSCSQKLHTLVRIIKHIHCLIAPETYQYHEDSIRAVREASEALNEPIAIALDTKGPEIRTGYIRGADVVRECAHLHVCAHFSCMYISIYIGM